MVTRLDSGEKEFFEAARVFVHLADIDMPDRGVWIDKGTWLRSHVRGIVSQFINGGTSEERQRASLQFWYENGEAVLRGVRVIAGVYPKFEVGKRYLVFLNPDKSKGLGLGAAFRITSEGILERFKFSNGAEDWPPSAFPGRNVDNVVEALKRVQ
ncbi:MAG: hypothetical protein ACRD2N_25560 [Vicinamibacterales bacterium]